LWELNEAFAVQVVYCRDRLGIDPAKLNVNGGSIAIGHPFGMTGARLVGTLANEMQRRKKRYGVVTMCIGGGQGRRAVRVVRMNRSVSPGAGPVDVRRRVGGRLKRPPAR